MDQFIEVLTQNAGIALAALAILSGTLIALVAIVAGEWRAIRENEEMSKLKHSLLDRGLTAEEITQVVEAGKRRGFRRAQSYGHREHARV
jgi:hypothetical protein